MGKYVGGGGETRRWKVGLTGPGMALAAALGACAVDGGEEPPSEVASKVTQSVSATVTTVPARSLAITAASVLEPCLAGVDGLTTCGAGGESTFSLRRTLETVLRTAGKSTQTPAGGESPMNGALRQLWDAHNTRAGAKTSTANPHCDDTKNAEGLATLNGFPVQCPRNEGVMATPGTDLLSPAAAAYFYPIALMNRLDLRDDAAATCGEFRVIYGRKDANGAGIGGRALVIFEAAFPNPRPDLGQGGCQPLADLWAGLSAPQVTASQARTTLAKLYYEGITVAYADGRTVTTGPVLHADNLGIKRGQVRTNEFMNGSADVRWQLREYKTRIAADGRLIFAPEYVKANPWPGLFDSATGSDAFSTWFVSQVPNLAINDVNTFFLDDKKEYGAGQSDSHNIPLTIQGPRGDVTEFANDYARFASLGLTLAVRRKLGDIGSSLSPANIFDRATAVSCGGCHQHSSNDNLGGGITWPASGAFVHVDETPATAAGTTDAFGQAGKSFAVSPALRDVFLPARLRDLRCVAFGECSGAVALTEDGRRMTPALRGQ